MKQVLPTVSLLYWKRELLILNYFTVYLVTLSDRCCFPKTLWMDIIMDNFYPTCFQPFRAKESNFMYIYLSCLTIFLRGSAKRVFDRWHQTHYFECWAHLWWGKNLLRPPQVARRQSTLTTLREVELCRKWRLPQRRGSPLSARCFRPRSRQKGDRNRDLRLIWVNYWGTKTSSGKRERYKSLPWREMSVLWDRSSQ